MRAIAVLLSSAILAAAVPPGLRDVHGRWLRPFRTGNAASVIFFVSTDCPISNAYAPEIQRLCGHYGSQGVGCALIYEDGRPDAAAVRRHLGEYRYHGIPAAIDAARTIAGQARASVTPQAVIIDGRGAIRYRGRIDNRFAAFGKARLQVTVHDVSDALEAVLGGRTVSTPETPALGCFIVPSDRSR